MSSGLVPGEIIQPINTALTERSVSVAHYAYDVFLALKSGVITDIA